MTNPALVPAGHLDRVRDYLEAEKSPRTRQAYASDFSDFRVWCSTVGALAMPADPVDVARYLASLADRGRQASTVTRRAAAIRYAHRAAGHESPTSAEGVRAVLRGIRHRLGTAPTRKSPATAQVLAAMVARIPDTLAGRRDRAILLLGFAAALRRSEVVALDADDLELTPEGIRVTVRRSKTDQAGEGRTISVPQGSKLRPGAAVRAWLEASRIAEGPLFRPIGKGDVLRSTRLGAGSVAAIVKRHARAIGLDPGTVSGHSLRAGFVTSALEAGADVLRVMDVTRHSNVNTLKTYDRRARGFRHHAGRGFL